MNSCSAQGKKKKKNPELFYKLKKRYSIENIFKFQCHKQQKANFCGGYLKLNSKDQNLCGREKSLS